MVKHRTAVKEEPVIGNGNHVPLAAFNNDKIDVNAEIDFEVQQITNLPYQNQGFQDVPSSNDRNKMGSTYPENNIGDLIQLDDPLPISNELHLKNDASSAAESFQPSPSPPRGSLSSPGQPQVEIMLYNLVRELYTRTCLLPNT